MTPLDVATQWNYNNCILLLQVRGVVVLGGVVVVGRGGFIARVIVEVIIE